MEKQLDRIDRTILEYLQRDARMTNTELAGYVNLSPPALQKRLVKLEESGLIQRYVAMVDRERLGFDLMCFVQVNLRRHEVSFSKEFKAAVQHMPEVLECHHLTGESDYLLKIVVRNRGHLERFLMETLTPAPGVERIRTSLVLREVKATTVLPLELIPEEDE
jgi:DNA-binding Lrp family transcriptional regulator